MWIECIQHLCIICHAHVLVHVHGGTCDMHVPPPMPASLSAVLSMWPSCLQSQLRSPILTSSPCKVHVHSLPPPYLVSRFTWERENQPQGWEMEMPMLPSRTPCQPGSISACGVNTCMYPLVLSVNIVLSQCCVHGCTCLYMKQSGHNRSVLLGVEYSGSSELLSPP